jgi:hypothetical protein
MKRKYVKFDGQSTCPMGMDGDQWHMLVAYWEECNTKKKSKQLVVVRSSVQNVNTYGRVRKAS